MRTGLVHNSDHAADDVDSDFGSELDYMLDDDKVIDPEEIVRALSPVDRVCDSLSTFEYENRKWQSYKYDR